MTLHCISFSLAPLAVRSSGVLVAMRHDLVENFGVLPLLCCLGLAPRKKLVLEFYPKWLLVAVFLVP